MPTGKPKTSKSVADIKDPRLDCEGGQVAASSTADDILVEPDLEKDDWAEFFSGEDGENVVVQLQRVSPDVFITDPDTGIESRTGGYCEDLPRGLRSYQEWIKTRYGGGIYRVQKRVSGVIRKQRMIHIQGSPLLGPPAKHLAPSAPSLPPEQYENVNIGGSTDEWESRMVRLLAMKKLLADPPAPPPIGMDLVNTLLTFLIEQKSPDPISQIQTFATLATAVKDLMPEQQTGSTMVDVINSAVKTVGQLIVRAPRASLPRGFASDRPRLNAGKNTGADTGQLSNHTQGQEVENMPEEISRRELAGIAIQNIVTAFRLQPPKEPERVVAMLDSALNMDADQRNQMIPFKNVLFDLAENQMEEDFAANPESREEFKGYFYKVFDQFVQADREVTSL